MKDISGTFRRNVGESKFRSVYENSGRMGLALRLYKFRSSVALNEKGRVIFLSSKRLRWSPERRLLAGLFREALIL